MICSDEDIMVYLGASLDGNDETLVSMLHNFAEREVKRIVQSQVEQANYTHYLPAIDDRRPAFLGRAAGSGSDILFLSERPVRSIASIYEDAGAYGGQGASPWAAATQLTAGTHFYLDVDESGLSRSGIVRRIGANWCPVPRSIKVTYTAGYSALELAGEYSAFKEAVIIGTVKMFKQAQSYQESAGGAAVLSESLADYSVTYGGDISELLGYKVSLPREALVLLEPFIPRGFL